MEDRRDGQMGNSEMGVDWFNDRRLLQPIENILPAEAEEMFYEQFNEFDKVA